MTFTINNIITKEDFEILLFTYLQQQNKLNKYNDVINILNDSSEIINPIKPNTTIEPIIEDKPDISIDKPKVEEKQFEEEFDNNKESNNNEQSSFNPKVDNITDWEDEDDNLPFPDITQTPSSQYTYKITSPSGDSKTFAYDKLMDLSSVNHSDDFINAIKHYVSSVYDINLGVLMDDFGTNIGKVEYVGEPTKTEITSDDLDDI